MLRIVTHIERLLLVHDCIIIPKLGGFVLQTIPASFDRENNRFSPLRKEVVFNSTLQHNDGLLSELYMKSYGVDYRKAQCMLEDDVQQLKDVLQQEGKVSLGNWGSFTLEAEGQILFRSNDVETFSLDTYGLPAFHFPPLSSQPQRLKQTAAKVPMAAPSAEPASASVWNWGWGRVAVASAAAVALFLLVSTPVKEVNPSAYTASFVPTEMVVSNKRVVAGASLKPKPQEAKSEVTSAKPADEEAKPEKPSVAEAKASEKAPVRQEQPAAKPAAKKKGKTYYIVIASFPTEAQANQFLAGVDRKVCRNADKVHSGSKYRIYADKYMSRAEAESYMKQLRNHPRYKDAWLFITR